MIKCFKTLEKYGVQIMEDKIGREEIVNKIDFLIETLPQDQNFCLALNGAWGSGKSVVIELLKEKFLNHPEYIVVHYDAWKNNFYSDPLIAMLYCILDTLEHAAPDKVVDSINSDRKKKSVKVVAYDIGGAIIDAVAEKNKVIGFIKGAIDKIKAVIKAYKETAFTNNDEFGEYKSYSTFLNQTIEQLNEITAQTFYENRQTRLVVLVDEIDRCLPNEQLLVLERMHHLFDVKNCAVVVALNRKAIHSNFERNYGNDSEEYLRKFFQYNFELPTNSTILLRNRLIDLFYYLNDKSKEPIIKTEVDFIINDLVKVLSEAQEKNAVKKIDNRIIDKYINDSKMILAKIINYPTQLLWFGLRLFFYRMFVDDLYNKVVIEKLKNVNFITDLSMFYGVSNKYAGFNDLHFFDNGLSRELRYMHYPDNRYNDLLYLFNLCRFRTNIGKLKTYISLVENQTLMNKDVHIKDILEQINNIVLEIERYRD